MKKQETFIEKVVMKIDKNLIDRFNSLMDKEEVDLEAENLDEDQVVFSQTAKFDNNIVAEIKVVTTQQHTLWCECVWFINGHEYNTSDVSYELDGEWTDDCGRTLFVEKSE